MAEDLDAKLTDLETRIETLRVHYERWLHGVEAEEPVAARKEVLKILAGLQKLQVQNNKARTRYWPLVQRWNVLQTEWNKRKKERGDGGYAPATELRRATPARPSAAASPDDAPFALPGTRPARVSAVEKLLGKAAEREEAARARRRTPVPTPSESYPGQLSTREERADAPTPVPSTRKKGDTDPDPLAWTRDRQPLEGVLREFLDENPGEDQGKPPLDEVKTEVSARIPVHHPPPPTLPRLEIVDDPPPFARRYTSASDLRDETRPYGALRRGTPAPAPDPERTLHETQLEPALRRRAAPPPTAAPPPPIAAPRAPTPAAGWSTRTAVPGMTDAELRDLHRRYLDAARIEMSFGALMATLARQVPTLLEQLSCSGLWFDVVEHEGKVLLQATPLE